MLYSLIDRERDRSWWLTLCLQHFFSRCCADSFVSSVVLPADLGKEMRFRILSRFLTHVRCCGRYKNSTKYVRWVLQNLFDITRGFKYSLSSISSLRNTSLKKSFWLNWILPVSFHQTSVLHSHPVPPQNNTSSCSKPSMLSSFIHLNSVLKARDNFHFCNAWYREERRMLNDSNAGRKSSCPRENNWEYAYWISLVMFRSRVWLYVAGVSPCDTMWYQTFHTSTEENHAQHNNHDQWRLRNCFYKNVTVMYLQVWLLN